MGRNVSVQRGVLHTNRCENTLPGEKLWGGGERSLKRTRCCFRRNRPVLSPPPPSHLKHDSIRQVCRYRLCNGNGVVWAASIYSPGSAADVRENEARGSSLSVLFVYRDRRINGQRAGSILTKTLVAASAAGVTAVITS